MNDIRRSTRPKKEDIFDLLAQVSKETFLLFNELKRLRHTPTNITCMPFKELTVHTARMNRIRLKQLIDLDLVCYARTLDYRQPIKKGSLMINPHMLATAGRQRAEAKNMWYLMKEGPYNE